MLYVSSAMDIDIPQSFLAKNEYVHTTLLSFGIHPQYGNMDTFNTTSHQGDPFANFTSVDNTNSTSSGRDAFEFVAFLLWYLFLVLCCVIPTCCAYRRRRHVETRIAQQQASVSRIERQNLYILSSIHQSQVNSERINERRDKIAEKLTETTMVRTVQ